MASKKDGTQFLLNIKPKYRRTVTPILQKLKENREASDFVCQAILEKVARDGISSIESTVEVLLGENAEMFAHRNLSETASHYSHGRQEASATQEMPVIEKQELPKGESPFPVMEKEKTDMGESIGEKPVASGTTSKEVSVSENPIEEEEAKKSFKAPSVEKDTNEIPEPQINIGSKKEPLHNKGLAGKLFGM